jgi:FkbM family methyltransferase
MEEDFILMSTNRAERKRALDIGAWHPTCFSNSRALIEQGWDAVLIEPSPGPVRNLVMEYGEAGKVQVVSAAVVVEDRILTSIKITDDGISSEVEANVEKWKEKGKFLGDLWVPAITIEKVLYCFGAFDFVSIDTEGSSVDLLKVLLATGMQPQCVCVEYDNRLAEAQIAAGARGYKSVYTSNENVVLSL